MSRFLQIVFLVLVVSPLAFAAGTKPSDASVKELMQVTQSRRLLDGEKHQMEASVRMLAQRELSNKKLTAKQRKIVEDMQSKMLAAVEDGMQWRSVEPTIIDVYKKTFSQHEINGMIAFYKSEVGHAVITKMPLVMRDSVEAMRGQLKTLVPKLQQLQRDAAQQMQQAVGK